MLAKTFLIIVAAMYIGLAIWCSVSPKATSEKVGFDLVGGSGKSEFITVYGGLEFGVALVLLYLALLRPETVMHGVVACTLIHASLVLFRTFTFFAYSDIGSFTYRLATGEWVIFLLGLAILFFGRKL